jgi:hypothetical protein
MPIARGQTEPVPCVFCVCCLQLKNVREQLGEAAVERCPAGFYYSESATTRFYALILPRNEKGLREVRSRGRVIYRHAQYFRLVRPATGVTQGDIPFDVSGCAAIMLCKTNALTACIMRLKPA